jgi:uncharacterized protein YegP (UPF0339 family)/sporulation protein YlmC with PRC-barrel domain
MKKYLVQAHRLELYDVVNKSGQDLGQVQEFMIDMTTGRIAYVVVSYGGILGLSDKWLAMPFDALCWAPDSRKFTVDIKPEVLAQAPGIDKDKWPEHYMDSETGWLDDLYAHYSCTPYWGNDTGEIATIAELPVAVAEPVAPMTIPMPEAAKETAAAPKRSGKFEIYQDKEDDFRFRLVASNGEIIAVSQGYASKQGAMNGIKSVAANAEGATTEDLTLVKT